MRVIYEYKKIFEFLSGLYSFFFREEKKGEENN